MGSDIMNFYLLYGNDKCIIEKEIDNLKNKLSITDMDIINYNITSVEDIVDEALTIGMFSLNKLIIIDCTEYLSLKKEVENIKLLEDYFDNCNNNSYLVFISNSDNIDSRKKLVKLISSKGEVKKLEANNDYLVNYITNYLGEYIINNMDINYFISRVGNNISNIDNELNKLMLYKKDDKIITKDDINILVSENMDNNIFDLVSSILKNENEKALKIYDKFILDGMDANQIIAIIASQIRLLYQVKRLHNLGKSNDEIARILEFKNVYRVKYLLSDSYYYSEEDLLKYISKLFNIDKRIKADNIDGNMLLELFIVGKDM